MTTPQTFRRVLLAAAMLAAVTAVSSACSTGVTASTSCEDFLKMDEQTQQTGVESLAPQSPGGAFNGPMGIMNLVYDCQETPSKTVGEVMGIST